MFEFLEHYVVYHFKLEEYYMTKYKYSEYQAHKNAPDSFIKYF